MWYAIVAILILIADQGLKYWVTLNIPLDTGHVTLIPGVLELTNIHNNGAAFSILQHAPHWLFVIFTVVFAAIAVFCLRRNIVHGKVGRWSVVAPSPRERSCSCSPARSATASTASSAATW